MPPGRRQRLTLLVAIMGSFAAGLDATAVNVALPAIRADLDLVSTTASSNGIVELQYRRHR
jgi:hypothetical protein